MSAKVKMFQETSLASIQRGSDLRLSFRGQSIGSFSSFEWLFPLKMSEIELRCNRCLFGSRRSRMRPQSANVDMSHVIVQPM